MPSNDPINPKVNAWMEGENLEVSQGLMAALPKPTKTKERPMAGQLLRLARRLGLDPDELAQKIPADTIRRLKYPVLEQRERDGARGFEHDIGIKTDGRISR
jgi:hypothetical protein